MFYERPFSKTGKYRVQGKLIVSTLVNKKKGSTAEEDIDWWDNSCQLLPSNFVTVEILP